MTVDVTADCLAAISAVMTAVMLGAYLGELVVDLTAAWKNYLCGIMNLCSIEGFDSPDSWVAGIEKKIPRLHRSVGVTSIF